MLEHGAAACSYQLLDPGVEHWLADGDDACVGFARVGRTWIAVGAPVTHADAPTAARAFAAAAARQGGRALWFLAEAPLRQQLDPARRWLRIGAQPVWSPDALLANFERRRSLRMQLHRAANKGVVVREWDAGRATGSLALARCLLHWLGTRRAPPLRFLAGPTLLPDLRDRRVFVAERDGAPAAYLVLAPIPARHGWLVEQIVRGSGSCNGTSETLLCAAAAALGAAGAALLTLGCAPLSRRCGMPWPNGVTGRALAAARRWGRRLYDFDGVDAFKAKFRPERWEPLYLGAADGPLRARDLWALARAEAGGNPIAFALRGLLRRRR
ncbi:MAG: phosphatidylglycerol lysyltransferase domain-containing protein [Planctomycetota bacterium]